MKIKLFCLAILFFATTALSAEEWTREFTVGAHPTLRVQTNDARIEVSGRPGNTVSARVITEGWHIGPGEATATAQQVGDTIYLHVKTPERHIRFNLGNRSLRIEVSVPQSTTLDLSSANGSVHVSGTKSEARLASSDGSIHVDNFDGALRAHTANGRIEVAGRFDLLDLNTSNGHISADVSTGSHMKDGWNLHTANGSITLRLPNDLSASLEAWTSNGRINFDLPIEVSGQQEKNHLRGKLHGGGPNLQVHTSDGSITLHSI
jgi:DUF4097 and DUF4098 domain-containing protein YvlB